MVSIPVRLYKAARRERMRFHHVCRRAEEVATPADERPAPEAPAPEVVARTCSMTVSEIDEAPIERTGILKGYEVEKDNYAVFEPREIAALPPPTSSDLEILAFVHLEEYALSAPKSWTWRRCSCAP
jgi:non-homologous end joining protein Ku